jgi:tetratricopeptide (TPR) repeat protein
LEVNAESKYAAPRKRRPSAQSALVALSLVLGVLIATCLTAAEGPADTLLAEALRAEAALDTPRALELYLAADRVRPNDPFILQKIARQHSDLIPDRREIDARTALAQTALAYAERAVALQPDNAVNVLSVAICRGQVAFFGGVRTRVQAARDVQTAAERALSLDPNYAWAHHVLGRWHREMVELGRIARLWVNLFYGGLPPGSLTKALEHLDHAVNLEPLEMAHQVERGLILADLNRTAEARLSIEQALALPDTARHHTEFRQRGVEALGKLPDGRNLRPAPGELSPRPPG